MNENKNFAAYPQTAFDKDGNLTTWQNEHIGLTKREYFAAKALQGLCAGRTEYENPMIDVTMAVKLSDLLLKALAGELNDPKP